MRSQERFQQIIRLSAINIFKSHCHLVTFLSVHDSFPCVSLLDKNMSCCQGKLELCTVRSKYDKDSVAENVRVSGTQSLTRPNDNTQALTRTYLQITVYSQQRYKVCSIRHTPKQVINISLLTNSLICSSKCYC